MYKYIYIFYYYKIYILYYIILYILYYIIYYCISIFIYFYTFCLFLWFIFIFSYVFKTVILYCYRRYLYSHLLNIMKVISIYFHHTNFYLKYLCWKIKLNLIFFNIFMSYYAYVHIEIIFPKNHRAKEGKIGEKTVILFFHDIKWHCFPFNYLFLYFYYISIFYFSQHCLSLLIIHSFLNFVFFQ